MALESKFDARAKADALDDEGFTFTDMEGDDHTLPAISAMRMKMADRLNKALAAGDDDATLAVIRDFAGDEVAAAIEEMPIGVSGGLLMAWIESTGPDADDESEGKEPEKRSDSRPTKSSGGRSRKT